MKWFYYLGRSKNYSRSADCSSVTYRTVGGRLFDVHHLQAGQGQHQCHGCGVLHRETHFDERHVLLDQHYLLRIDVRQHQRLAGPFQHSLAADRVLEREVEVVGEIVDDEVFGMQADVGRSDARQRRGCKSCNSAANDAATLLISETVFFQFIGGSRIF